MTQDKLQTLFKDYFGLYNPSLSKGAALLAMLLDNTLKRGELDLVFNLLANEIAPYLQENSSTEEKAEIFRLVLFDKLKFLPLTFLAVSSISSNNFSSIFSKPLSPVALL